MCAYLAGRLVRGRAVTAGTSRTGRSPIQASPPVHQSTNSPPTSDLFLVEGSCTQHSVWRMAHTSPRGTQQWTRPTARNRLDAFIVYKPCYSIFSVCCTRAFCFLSQACYVTASAPTARPWPSAVRPFVRAVCYTHAPSFHRVATMRWVASPCGVNPPNKCLNLAAILRQRGTLV